MAIRQSKDISLRRATMADVALKAQVSTATVSYLLSGRRELMLRVGAVARQRIFEAVEELGYVQNKTARHLRRQRTERLCVILSGLGPFADKMAEQIDEVARRRGHTTVLVIAREREGFARVISDIEAGLADALIADAQAMRPNDIADLLEPLVRGNKACLMMYAEATDGDYSMIVHERASALSQALAHAFAAGHRHIAYVTNRSERLGPRAGLVAAFALDNPGMAPPFIVDGGESRARAASRAHEIVRLCPRPTMVLVESDYTAIAMMGEFQRLGLRVPTDIAVIGCGNAEEGYYCNPRLSTIGPESWSMTAATEALIDLIERRPNSKPSTTRVPWTLYTRESG